MQRWGVLCWALLALVGADVCPGGGRCGEGQSCCKDPSGGYMCCPSVQWDYIPSVVICSDGVSQCPDEHTCCETPDGKYACCPSPQAVCCEDKLHCCPHGTTCDLEHSMCVSTTTKMETPMLAKIAAKSRADRINQIVHDSRTEKSPKDTEADLTVSQAAAAHNVPCDETAACPDGTTCCKTTGGGWSCCPLPEAVCCSDLVHCCPKGMACDLPTLTCNQDGFSIPLLRKVPTVPILKARDVQCDSTHSCLDGSTCCKTTTGEWACCPLPQAVCCDDHVHCCPAGTTCDPQGLKCNSPLGSVPMSLKTAALVQQAPAPAQEENAAVQCDAHTSCPQGSTCCFMETSKEWGCCPLPEAVCCADGNHCCPVHYKCDEKKTTCVKGSLVIPWYPKLPAIRDDSGVRTDGSPLRQRDIQCPDHSTCQDGQTCCKMSATQYGCCPYSNAVCCDDFQHCCPSSYTCVSGQCVQSGSPRWDNGLFLNKKKRFPVV